LFEHGYFAPAHRRRRAGPVLLIIDRQPGVWRRQILDDRAPDHDWGVDVGVNLEVSDEEGVAVVSVLDAGRLD